jgi:hypothetical protein
MNYQMLPPTPSNYLTLTNKPLSSIFALHSKKQYLYTQNTLNPEIRKKNQPWWIPTSSAMVDFMEKLSFAWFGKWGTAKLKNTQISFLIYNQSQS